jgi:hypothetical protein
LTPMAVSSRRYRIRRPLRPHLQRGPSR